MLNLGMVYGIVLPTLLLFLQLLLYNRNIIMVIVNHGYIKLVYIYI